MPTKVTTTKKRRSTSSSDEDAATKKGELSRARPRRAAAAVTYQEDTPNKEDKKRKDESSSGTEESSESEDEEEENGTAPSKRRSGARGGGSNTQRAKKQRKQQAEEPSQRRSSRSTKFRQSLKEPPGDSIKDLFQGESMRINSNKQHRKSKTTDDSSDDDDDEPPRTPSPQKQRKTRNNNVPKSPAVRHSTQRRRVKTEMHVESSDSESEDSDVDSSEGEDDDEIKVQRILASRSEPRKKWKEICQNMNTSEIDYGSRWFQDDVADDEDKTMFEERFLVKWGDLSYLHCSWENEPDLIDQVDGAKAYLTTFFRKSENGLLFTADERCDGDYFDPGYVQIERILQVHLPENVSKKARNYGIVMDKKDPKFESGTGRQFLIKWVNTPYSDATYEFERDLILNEVDYKEHVDAFLERSKKPRAGGKPGEIELRRLKAMFGGKISESEIKEYQNDLATKVFPNGGQLRDYQAEGVAWLMANHTNERSSILADEMGLGKTIQTAVYVNHVSTTLKKRGPFLIVAPLSTVPHWYREFTGWTKLNTIVYHGSAKDREIIREFEIAYESTRPTGGVGFNRRYLSQCAKKSSSWMAEVVITTPEMLVTDDFAELTAIKWEIIVVDEAHRLKNHASKLASNLRDDRFTFRRKLLLTGTPIQNNMSELWTLMNIVDEKKFSDMDEFLDKYGEMKSKERIDELHEGIRPYILRRLKEDVEKSVPPKEETLIEVELTVLQKQYYRALYEKNVQFLHRNKKKAMDGPSINNLAMQLRKCCNHPFLLNGVEEEIRDQEKKAGKKDSEADFLVKASGKLVLLDKLIPRLKENGHRILIFSQFKIMLDIIADYLSARVWKHERIDGSITCSKRQMAIDRFQGKNKDSTKELPFIMLLSTRAGGVGINLTAADTCIIFDSDWNPQNDLQAQARCHRIGQTKSVKVYRLLSRKTYEMQMFHMSSLKMGLDQAVLQGFENGGSGDGEGAMTKAEVERLLRHGAYDIFNEEKSGDADTESNEFVRQDIDSILERRSKTVIHENTGSKSSAAGGTFSKASFKAPQTPGGETEKANKENVDIDDPEFWKKIVGEGIVEEDSTNLAGKKRKRTKANYSEKAYDRRLTGTLDGSDGRSETDSSSDEESGSEDWSDEETESSLSKVDGDVEGGSVRVGRVKKMRNKRERGRWGGPGPTDWSKAEAEKLFKALQMYGYGNLSWDSFVEKIDFDREVPHSTEEIKRMCWSLILILLRDAADEDTMGAERRAQRAEEKKRAAEGNATPPPSPSKGGVLGTSRTNEEPESKASFRDAREQALLKLWRSNASWLVQVVADATAYAKTTRPRPKEVFEHAISGENKKPLRTQKQEGLLSLFVQNIWPPLKVRGWKSDIVPEGKYAGNTHYIYDNRQYRSPLAVLTAVPALHPELSKNVESVLANAASAAEEHENACTMEAAKATLDPISFHSLALFLQLYSPLPLLVERSKKHCKFHLSRKVFNACSSLHTANALVKRCDTTPGGDLNDKMVKLLYVDKRMALPHPSWTPRHDAVLVRAIAKHGWIDHDVCCRSITEDSSIKWGMPFDDGFQGDSDTSDKDIRKPDPISREEARRNDLSSNLLRDTAMRAAAFFNAEHDMIEELKGFNQNLVRNAYGIAQQLKEDDSESDIVTWVVDDDLLKQAEEGACASKADERDKDKPSELAELPTKKDLLKRAKTVLARSVGSLTSNLSNANGKNQVESQPDTPPAISHKYTVLYQGDQCNILLAEMLRGLLKAPFARKGNVSNMSRKLCTHACQEARRRHETIEELLSKTEIKAGEDPASALRDEMKNIVEHIEEVSRHIKGASRPAKNILRVMLGIPPIPSKIDSSEEMFPSDKKQLSVKGGGDKSAPRRKRKSNDRDKKKEKDQSPSGDRAISRAMARACAQEGGIPGRFSKQSDPALLELTAIETLLLSVICSQGLPIWTPHWGDIVEASDVDPLLQGPGCQYAITWSGMGLVVESAAQVWHHAASSKLQAKVHMLEEMLSIDASMHSVEIQKTREKIAFCEVDEKIKKRALSNAVDYCKDPLTLAKKCIMLLAAVRQRMGPVETKRGVASKKGKTTIKSDSGLGPNVLSWTMKELNRWAQCLGITDATGKVFSDTAADYILKVPQYSDNEWIRISAILDKKNCRSVFSQIAQQTRTRSVFLKYTDAELTDVMQKAIKHSRAADDMWLNRPSWWGNTEDDPASSSKMFDCELLSGLLEYGYSGFEDILENNEVFRQHVAQSSAAGPQFSKADAQERANQLARELHTIDETECLIRMVGERRNRPGGNAIRSATHIVTDSSGGNGVQAAIQAYFAASQPASNGTTRKEPVIVLSDSDEIVDDGSADGVSLNNAKRSDAEVSSNKMQKTE